MSKKRKRINVKSHYRRDFLTRQFDLFGKPSKKTLKRLTKNKHFQDRYLR